VIFQAGVSEDGRNLAAQVAEGIYAPGGSLAEAQAYYADIKRRAAGRGRDPDHVVIFSQHDLDAPFPDVAHLSEKGGRTRVVPLLQKRGVFRTGYAGDTLRSHLGLPVPVNRYTAAREG
jgi:hypothetical protein